MLLLLFIHFEDQISGNLIHYFFSMSINVPTSRRIMYMHCHVDEVSLEVTYFFLFQRNILIWSFLYIFFFKKDISFPFFSNSILFAFLLYTLNHLPIRFPSCFTLSILFQFVIHIYIFLYINETIVEKLDLNFFRELFWSLGVLQPNLRNPTWILFKKILSIFYFFIFIFGWSPTQF